MSKRNGREYRQPETESGDENNIVYRWDFPKQLQPHEKKPQAFSFMLWFREVLASRFRDAAVK